MVGLKYDMFIPAECLACVLEHEARTNKKSAVYGAQFDGSTISKVVDAVNMGNKQRRPVNFRTRMVGRSGASRWGPRASHLTSW